MDSNKSPQEFPYKTYLNILHGPLELIDVQNLADACMDKWYNQTLCKVNDSVVRMAVVQGEYHWHEHKDIDEFFFVLDGRFVIDLKDRIIELAPRQGFVVPKGVRHRTRAAERAVILMKEGRCLRGCGCGPVSGPACDRMAHDDSTMEQKGWS